ncbi:MAG: DUF488 family protein [Psychrobacter sp.]|nr:DUF488 family protein [Psychrobacter sp.]
MSKIKIRRAYTEKGKDDGYCILVDRLWPRGIKKEDLSYSWWPKDIAPSDKLRKSFDHDADKFSDFKKSYKKELEDNELKDEFLDKVKYQLEKHNVTFIYSAKDEEHNQAVVLKQWAEEKIN